MTSAESRTYFRWLLDTRELWQEEPFEQTASRALALLKPHERLTVIKHHFTRDSKLRLASYLLKYLAIHDTCHVPWADIVLSADKHGKPCYTPPSPSSPGVQFNVSHQAGLVALVGTTSHTITNVGIDIVCTFERARRDIESIDKEGFEAWVEIYTEVFSAQELDDIKHTLPTPIYLEDGRVILTPKQLSPHARCCTRNQPLLVTVPVSEATGTTKTVKINSNLIIDAKLRNFYAHWCLKEAYIKMTGEALLADWLRNLEIRNVCPPSPLLATDNTQGRGKAWGETIGGDFDIWRGGERIRDVEMEIQAFEEGYMIATAVTVAQSTSDDPSSAEECSEDFEELDLKRDILLAAEADV